MPGPPNCRIMQESVLLCVPLFVLKPSPKKTNKLLYQKHPTCDRIFFWDIRAVFHRKCSTMCLCISISQQTRTDVDLKLYLVNKVGVLLLFWSAAWASKFLGARPPALGGDIVDQALCRFLVRPSGLPMRHRRLLQF